MLLTSFQAQSRSRRTLRRWALGLAGAALVGQIAGFVHLSITPHGICAAHGEAVHADDAPAPARSGYGYEAPTRAGTGESHEHCLVVSGARERIAPTLRTPLPAPSSTQATPVAPEARVSHVSIATLLLAPKSSPPA